MPSLINPVNTLSASKITSDIISTIPSYLKKFKETSSTQIADWLSNSNTSAVDALILALGSGQSLLSLGVSNPLEIFSAVILGKTSYQNRWQMNYMSSEDLCISYFDGTNHFKRLSVAFDSGTIKSQSADFRNGNTPSCGANYQLAFGYSQESTYKDYSLYRHNFRTNHSNDAAFNYENSIDLYAWDLSQDAPESLGSRHVMRWNALGNEELISGFRIDGGVSFDTSTDSTGTIEQGLYAVPGKGVLYYNNKENQYRYSVNGGIFNALGGGSYNFGTLTNNYLLRYGSPNIVTTSAFFDDGYANVTIGYNITTPGNITSIYGSTINIASNILNLGTSSANLSNLNIIANNIQIIDGNDVGGPILTYASSSGNLTLSAISMSSLTLGTYLTNNKVYIVSPIFTVGAVGNPTTSTFNGTINAGTNSITAGSLTLSGNASATQFISSNIFINSTGLNNNGNTDGNISISTISVGTIYFNYGSTSHTFGISSSSINGTLTVGSLTANTSITSTGALSAGSATINGTLANNVNTLSTTYSISSIDQGTTIIQSGASSALTFGSVSAGFWCIIVSDGGSNIGLSSTWYLRGVSMSAAGSHPGAYIASYNGTHWYLG